MTETVADPPPLRVAPGRCSEHPDLELQTRARLYGRGRGYWRHSTWDTLANVCPSPAHASPDDRRQEPPRHAIRCRWDGKALYPGPAIPAYGDRWEPVNERRAYCDDGCRLLAFRNRRRSAVASATLR